MLGGRQIRRARFERRSSLPIAAACLIANGIRETLAMLVAKAVRVRLMEPVCPDPDLWPVLVNDARLYQVRGTLNTATFVLGSTDAIGLTRMLFGASEQTEDRLSRIEEHVLGRMIEALAATLAPVCGKTVEIAAPGRELPGWLTFLDVLIEEPVSLRLGIALTRDTFEAPAPLFRAEHLLDVRLHLTAQTRETEIDSSRLMRLEAGAVVPLGAQREGCDRLKMGDRTVAVGTCGAHGDSRAFSVSKLLSAA